MTVTGAYGFRLSGLQDDAWLSVSGASHWPEISCQRDGGPDAPELSFDPNADELRVRADIPHSELVHPLLGRMASHLAPAHGLDGMHAGAVAGNAGAWAIIGPKGAGKSTLLASLNDLGVPIVTDDVLICRDGTVMAGPRCIDLRPDTQRFGLGIAVRPSDPRNRIALAPIAAEHPLRGLIHLEWSSDDTATERLDHREAIRRLLILRSDNGYPRDPRLLLDLATLPTLLLKRPRSMHRLDAAGAEVVRLLSDPATGPRRSAHRGKKTRRSVVFYADPPRRKDGEAHERHQ
jgi:energy-coupling factor transporter ATP-binding protein EcfA2